MTPIPTAEILSYVEKHLLGFHANRIAKLKKLKLKDVLKHKNPYLFRVRNITTAAEFVTKMLDAYLSSQEETLLGDFLEGLAIHICKYVYGGHKSSAEGIDLELEKGTTRYIVSIKSGPNWGNSQQIKKMKENFLKAKRILKTSKSSMHIEAINGCCYGKNNKPDRGAYHKLRGQQFWEFISGAPDLYT